MNLSSLLQEQVRIQKEAITLWKIWIVALIFAGVLIIALAQLVKIAGAAGGEIIKIGGAFISILSAFPYREMGSRKERLATYTFLLERFQSFDSLTNEDRATLMSLANDALKETLKR